MLAKIYRPSKNAMQSGRALERSWVLEFESGTAPHADALMGWTSSTDTSGQVRLHFDNKELAIAYARRHGIPHQVIDPPTATRIIKSYSDNFAFTRREPWSH